MSIKYSAEGFSGIKWVDLSKEETKYGSLPTVTSLII
jgi:hypothetical protein